MVGYDSTRDGPKRGNVRCGHEAGMYWDSNVRERRFLQKRSICAIARTNGVNKQEPRGARARRIGARDVYGRFEIPSYQCYPISYLLHGGGWRENAFNCIEYTRTVFVVESW